MSHQSSQAVFTVLLQFQISVIRYCAACLHQKGAQLSISVIVVDVFIRVLQISQYLISQKGTWVQSSVRNLYPKEITIVIKHLQKKHPNYTPYILCIISAVKYLEYGTSCFVFFFLYKCVVLFKNKAWEERKALASFSSLCQPEGGSPAVTRTSRLPGMRTLNCKWKFDSVSHM